MPLAGGVLTGEVQRSDRRRQRCSAWANAASLIEDGKRIRIDGSKGTVTVLDQRPGS